MNIHRYLRIIEAVVVVGVLAATFATVRGTEAAQVPPVTMKLDHFKRYQANGKIVPPPVTLVDQFNDADNLPVQVKLGPAEYFLNPVQKSVWNGTKWDTFKMLHEENHLELYPILDSLSMPTRTVLINNQFDVAGVQQVLDVGKAMYLAVPTQKVLLNGKKTGLGTPVDLSHFKGYRVSNGNPVYRVVTLKDEFGVSKNVIVLEPVMLFNPTEKRIAKADGTVAVTPIVNPDLHLVAYRTVPLTSFKAVVGLKNQFGSETIDVFGNNYLLVPSFKKIIK
ncbi:MAG: hypothetical protein Q7T05_06590 [Dehalococcoidia bacterium]|nr:hypothetical protein [Dehalococcoidia bacterium]